MVPAYSSFATTKLTTKISSCLVNQQSGSLAQKRDACGGAFLAFSERNCLHDHVISFRGWEEVPDRERNANVSDVLGSHDTQTFLDEP